MILNTTGISNLSLSERLKYRTDISDELKEEILDTISSLNEELVSLYRRDELAEEQWYFRQEFIEGVLEDIYNCTKYRELKKAIITRLENSYIEL